MYKVIGRIMKNFIIVCPHCNEPVIIHKLNCGIFRHGVVKKTKKPIHSHLNQVLCDELVNKKLIYGCGKPFRLKIIQNENEQPPTIEVHVCDYI